MFSEYTLFSDQSTSTGINELSPSSDAIVTNHWNTSHSAPIGKSPIQENSSPPPHILGMFSPSSKTESLLSSLVLSPTQDIAYSSPRSEFSDDEDFSFSPQLAEHDEFLQSMGGMEDVEIPYYGERAAQRVSRQPISSPSWQNTNVPYTSPVGSPQYGSPPFTKLAKSPATPIPPAGQSMEHPHGEHPSRTLFVRNINSNVEEQEIRDLFEAYGPTRSIYSQCKHRGFVMVSFYDIRHAKNAIRHLQGRLLRRRKLDIHYSIPRNNPSEKDQNQGTLVVFNLDPSTTHNELLEIFGAFGEIKEIRETPNKKHHKFIEFYDVRDAEQAMKFLNRTEIKGKRIKIEPSRPGGRKANNSQGSPVHSVQRDSAFQNPSNYLYSSSYDGSGFQDFAGYDTISTSYSPPSSFNSSMFIPPPTNSSPVSQVGSSGQFLRPPRSISLPASHQDAKRNRSRSAISQSSWEQNINARGAPHSATSSPKEEENSQFVLDVNEILSGLETRTTLMIRNIPNKYTQKMLLSAIDEVSRGLYDFFYLPIDFKNKCNVGYAFINFIHPLSIVEFYNSFHQQKWERFNSEKVCKISFARIQGKESLVLRFQNSSLMSEDKKCRPIIFYSNGPRVGQQEPFPVGSNVSVRQEDNFASSYTPPMQIPFQRLSSDDPAKPSRLRSLSFNPIS